MTDILLKRTTGDVYFSTPINEGAKRVRKLMADDYLSLPISTYEPLDIRLGDYVDIPNEGRFCIIETQYPSVSEESNSYDYELKFEAQYRKFANKIFKFHPQSGASECSWKLTANIEVHVEQVLKAMNALGTQSPSYYYNGSLEWETHIDSTIDIDVAKFISYDNINILDGISAIAETFECEWWVTDNVLHFGRCEFGDTYIEISRELNAVNISRSDTNEKTANRIYPFGSTENLPPKYNKALIFDVTNIYGASDSDYPNQIAIYDAQRPLTHEWFDSSLWKADEDTREIIYGVEESGSTSFVENDKEGKMVNIALHMFPLNYASFGKNKIILKAFRPYVNASENLDGGGQFATFPTLTIRGIYSYTLKDDEDRETYTEQNPLSVSKVTSSISNGYQLAMEDEEVIFEIPKTIVIDDIEREIDTISDIKIALDYRVKVYNKGVVNWTIYASNDYFVWEAENVKYSVQDVRLNFLNGKLQDEPIKAILDPSFADKGYALVLSNVSSEIVEIGDNFVIANINEKFVPSSYYSYPPSNDDSSNEVINAIADGRLMLSKDKGNYIDAYRYINGEKVFIGEQGYDDAEDMPLEEAIEDVVIFEDVKPDHTFRITNSWYVMEEGKDGDGNPTTTYRFFFNDELFTADNQFNDSYIIEDKDLSIRFSSGKLNGMSFGLAYSNNYTLDRFPTEWVESFNNSLGDVDLFLPDVDENVRLSVFKMMQSLSKGDMSNNSTCWEIIVDEESHLPSTFYMPEVGDEFTMSGLNVSIIDEQYLPMAEEKLYDVAFGYVKNTNLDASSYDCTMFADVMADGLALPIGQRVLLKENVFFKNGRQSRVIGYEYPLDYPYDNPKYTIGEKASYSRFGDIESKLESIELSVKGQSQNVIINTNQNTGGVGYIIGTNDNVTPESNQNVYSALKSLKEFVSRTKNEVVNYLWRFTKGINIGHFLSGASGATIDSEGNAEVEKLTSRNEIKSQEVISNNIHTTDFAQGALLGTGGAMYQLNGATYAEFDYLTARKGATFAELIIQEYRSIGGALVISQANGEIERIYDYGNGYNIWLKDDDRGDSLFANKDLVRCQYWDKGKNELVYYWTPVSVGADLQGRYVLTIYKKDMNGVVPQVGDKLVQMGNTTDTSRQGCILLTTENSMPRMAILDGINTTQIKNTNYKGIYGSLDGFVDPYKGKELSGYGMWGENVYLHGDLVVSSTNTTISSELANLNNALTSTKALIDEDIREINNRLDGVVTNWFGDDVPRLDNHPAEQWTTEQEKMNHIGDTYTNTETTGDNAGRSWRWVQENGEYKWIQITDSDAVKALQQAQNAQSTADGKRRVFVTQPTTPYDEGDLWVKQEGEKTTLYYSIADKAKGQPFAESDWLIGATDDTAIKDLQIGGTNLLVGTNQGVNNWSFSSSLYTYTTKEISYNGASGVQIIKSNPLEYADWEVIRYPLRSELIKKDKKYHLTFDFMQSAENDIELGVSVSLNNPNGNNPLTNAVSLKSKNIGGIWQHFDVEFTAIANGNKNDGRIVYFNIQRNTNEWKDFAITNLKLEEGNKATTWSPSPEDAESALILLKTETTAKIEKLDDRITQSVTETKTYADGKVETLQGYVDTKADEVSLGVRNDLERTGINITDGNIVAKTQNFEIQNQNGNTTARINADGLIEGTSGFATTYPLVGAPAPHINKLDEKLTFYHMSGKKALEIGIDNNTNSFIRVYDENGNMTWKLGTEARFLTDEITITYSPLTLIKYSNRNEIPYENENLTEGAKTYYKEQSNLETNGLVRLEASTDSSSIPDGIYALAGYPTPVRVPASNGGIELKYRRTYYVMKDGRITLTSYVGYIDKVE